MADPQVPFSQLFAATEGPLAPLHGALPPAPKWFETVTAAGVRSPDLGGTARTDEVTDAVCEALAESAAAVR